MAGQNIGELLKQRYTLDLTTLSCQFYCKFIHRFPFLLLASHLTQFEIIIICREFADRFLCNIRFICVHMGLFCIRVQLPSYIFIVEQHGTSWVVFHWGIEETHVQTSDAQL